MLFDAGATSPLQGIRVLDFTHVLAGPRSARTLAYYGAEVLHISSPAYSDTFAQHLGVDEGKKCAYLDLCEASDRETMQRLARGADVFTNSYRPGVNTRFGLSAAELAAASERGIVCRISTHLVIQAPRPNVLALTRMHKSPRALLRRRGSQTNQNSHLSSTWATSWLAISLRRA